MKMKSVFMLMAAFVLASCSKSEVEEPIVSGSDEITLGTPVIHTNSVSSRAPYEATTITAKDSLVARVLASQANTFATLYCNGTMTFRNASAVTYNKPVTSGRYDFLDGNAVYLCGLHPAVGWDVTTTAGKAIFTLDGKDDIMLAPQVSTTRGNVGDGTYSNLAFAHELTLMKVGFKGDTDAITAKTRVTSLKLTKVNGEKIPEQVIIDLDNAATTVTSFSTTTQTDLDCYGLGTDSIAFIGTSNGGTPTYSVTNANVQKAYVIAPFVTATDANTDGDATYEYTFTVTYEVEVNSTFTERTAVIDVDLKQTDAIAAFTDSTAGNAFNLAFTFIGRQIAVTASVTAWTLGGNVNMDI